MRPPHFRLLTKDFFYELPPSLIAQSPPEIRGASRLLALGRANGAVSHHAFADLPGFLTPGDLLVVNNSKVIPARLSARRLPSGGEAELFLLEERERNCWWCLLRPGKRLRPGATVEILNRAGEPAGVAAQVLEKNEEGHGLVRFGGVEDLRAELPRIGRVPLPPYISREDERLHAMDLERYQTVYAKEEGSVAAPTAGLHLTGPLLETLRAMGIGVSEVTLHVGLGTFNPVKTDHVEEHRMHQEFYRIPAETLGQIQRAKAGGRRVVAIGTTSLRVLEGAARKPGGLEAGTGWTDLFLHPPAPFYVVDALVTNFHLPESTLLMLVSAFAAPGSVAGREMVLAAYREAVRENYRFFSYGDAMLIH